MSKVPSRLILKSLRLISSNLALSNFSSKISHQQSNSFKTIAPTTIKLNESNSQFKLIKANYSTDNKNASDNKKRFDELLKNKQIVLFMKGTPQQPMCGFSKAVCDILNLHGVKFDSYNVLADESLRSGVKEYTDWPTIPQIFFNGEFIGGCDILIEMHRSGELVEELKRIGVQSKLAEQK